MPGAHPVPDAELGLRDGHQHDETLHNGESHELQPLSPKHEEHQPHHYAQHLREEWHAAMVDNEKEVLNFWHRFTGRNRWVGWRTSIKNIVMSSWLNVFYLVMPFAWAAGISKQWGDGATFALCFISIIPMEKMFDFGGEQMAYYLGLDLGDLVVITLNNAVEATLAIVLLIRCETKLLQSTIAGVVLLHLLLVPGTAFLTGGARIWEQNMHPRPTQLNHSLLTIGVLTLLIPTAFFTSVSRTTEGASVVTDLLRRDFEQMSRGLALILLFVYIGSRIYMHNPPGEDNALKPDPHAPAEIKHEEHILKTATPEVNVWSCMIMLVGVIALMGTTAEMLVESIEFVREANGIQAEWFGLILLPIVSFSADAAIAIAFFVRYTMKMFLGTPSPPATLAKARSIDLSIQFTLFWMPFLVMLGWWTGKPLSLLFDMFEVALLVGACFLVNYVTADAKTNWAEGAVLVAFYGMIALCAWFYTGEPLIEAMVTPQCGKLADAASNEGTAEIVERMLRAF